MLKYRKIPKISPGAYIFQRLCFVGAYIRREISLIVGRKFTVLALFYFVFEGNFQVQAPGGAYIWRGDLTEGSCVTSLGGLYLEGLIFEILRYYHIFKCAGFCLGYLRGTNFPPPPKMPSFSPPPPQKILLSLRYISNYIEKIIKTRRG